MKKSKLFWLLLLVMNYNIVIAKRKVTEEKLEPALIEVSYERRTVTDTLDRENDFKTELMTLKSGLSMSAFYNAQKKSTDSLEYRHRELWFARYDNKDNNREYSLLPKDKVFKNYPESKLRVHDRFDLCNWIIDEDWEKPEWTVMDSTENILGYECLLAVSEYRGRKWYAWFAPEIPVSDGPWKLCGLPGIILRAQDSLKDYTYTAISVKIEDVGYVEYYDYDGNRWKTDRMKGLKKKRKFLQEDIGYRVLSSGMAGPPPPGLKKRDKIPHRNYDFEETDYPHE